MRNSRYNEPINDEKEIIAKQVSKCNIKFILATGKNICLGKLFDFKKNPVFIWTLAFGNYRNIFQKKGETSMKMKQILSVGLAAAMLLASSVMVSAAEAQGGGQNSQQTDYELQVGAAVRDITPTEENGMLPIAAVGRTTAEGVIDPLHTRVIALNDGENTALIVSNETGKGPYGPLFAQELSDHTGVPLENIFYTATHAHATPEITSEIDMSYITFDEDNEEVDNLQKWGRLVYDQMMDAADEAIANLEPVTMGIGYSDSYINVNRNAKYTNADGTYYWAQGYDFEGFSDKTLAAIRFTSIETGNPVAFIFNYAVHGVVMYANQVLDGKTGISSDIGGYVCNALEDQNEGAVAMFLMGAAGDQNPIFGNEIFTPSIETGEKETTNQGSVEVLEWLGKMLYFDTKEAIKNIDTETGNASLGFEYGTTAIPASDGGDYEVALQVLRIGSVALVGFPGEMFNEIGVNAIEESPVEDTLWVNLVWSHEGQSTGYHSTDLITVEGGQGRNKNYLPGYLQDAVTELTNELVAKSIY